MSSDPLSLLRTAISSGQLPTLLNSADESCTLVEATHITFPSTSTTLPVTTPTRFSVQDNDASEFHTLQQLYYVYVERETGTAEYMRRAQAVGGGVGMRVVGIVNRKLVLDYLEGKTEAPPGRVLVEGSDPAQGLFEGTAAPSAPIVKPELVGVSDTTATTTQTPAGRPNVGIGFVKRKYEFNPADLEAVKKIKMQEISLQDRHESLRASPGGKKNDFSALRRQINDTQIKPLRTYLTELASSGDVQKALALSKRPISKGTAAPVPISDSKAKRGKLVNIIVISSSPTALISMWNVKRFLEEGVYESTEEAKQRQQAEGTRKTEDVVVVHRKIQAPDGQTRLMKYMVVENADSLQKLGSSSGDDLWERVLCVFTTGQTWQFRPYKWQDPRELFRHVRGVYFYYSNDRPSPAVKDWKVTSLQIDPFKRHTDRQVVTTFWNQMDSTGRR